MALTTNLVEYHKLDADYSDATGNGNTATNNATTITGGGIISSCASLNGTSGYMRSAVTPGADGAISIWFKASATPSNNYIIGNTTIGTSDYLRILLVSNTSIQFVVKDDAVTPTVAAIGTSSWHHAVLSWSSSAAWTAYFDGALVGTGVGIKNPTNANTIPIGVLGNGAGIWSTPGYFAGNIDEIGIYTRALSGAEVSQLYNGGAGFQYPFVAPSIQSMIFIGEKPALFVY